MIFRLHHRYIPAMTRKKSIPAINLDTKTEEITNEKETAKSANSDMCKGDSQPLSLRNPNTPKKTNKYVSFS